jgi:uncharacterized protein (DUF1697 family)
MNETYVSLLRGINVSGKNIIKMDTLRTLYEKIGFKNVSSYIQSGNVIFEYSNMDVQEIERKVGHAIETEFGYDVTVIAKTSGDWEKILRQNPFIQEADIDVKKLHVTFAAGELPDESAVYIDPKKIGNDRFAIWKNVIFVYCPDGYGRAKLTNSFLEKNLGLAATTRNWNTVIKLNDLLPAAKG